MDNNYRRIRRNRRKNKKNKAYKIRNILKNISLVLMVCVLVYTALDIMEEYKIEKIDEQKIGLQNYYVTKSINEKEVDLEKEAEEFSKKQEVLINKDQNEEKKEIAISEVASSYLGYDVCALLEIPKIKLETEVLSEYTEEALEKCVTKFYGPDPNTIGNFVIIGHNYQNVKMFKKLKELEEGDKIYLTDNVNGKNEYVVNKIYRVDKKNVECLSQSDKNEITLITCVNYTDDRLIIKASINNE